MSHDMKPIMQDTLMPKSFGAKRGRPPLEDPLTPVTVWVPQSVATRLDHISTQNSTSVSKLVRQMLFLRLR